MRATTALQHAHAEAYEEATEQWLLAADAALASGHGLLARLWLKRAKQASEASHQPHDRLAVWLRKRPARELESLGVRQTPTGHDSSHVRERKIETQV